MLKTSLNPNSQGQKHGCCQTRSSLFTFRRVFDWEETGLENRGIHTCELTFTFSLSPCHTHPEIAFLRTSITPVCRSSSLVSSRCKCPLRWWTAWGRSEDAQLQQSSLIYVGKQELMKWTASIDRGLKIEHPPLHKLILSFTQSDWSDNPFWQQHLKFMTRVAVVV